jgi:hypothetical protein
MSVLELLVRNSLSLFAAAILLAGGTVAAAQEAAPNEPLDPAIPQQEELLDPEIPQQERICDLEIARVEAILDETVGEFGRMEQMRLRTQLDEARAYCDDNNEVMAAIRLEAVAAVIEVTGVGE